MKAAKKVVTDAQAVEEAGGSAVAESVYTNAIAAYLAVYNPATKLGSIVEYIANFTVNGELSGAPVKSNAQIAEDKENTAKDIASKLAALKSYAIGDFYDGYKSAFDTLYDDIKTVDGTDEVLYVADKTTGATKVTVLGVEVAKKAVPTAAEKKAIISALYTKINSTLTIAEKAANAGADVEAMYSGSDAKVFLATIKNAEVIADKYAEVVKYADGLKAEYVYGKKVYDDVKVDAVKAAAEDVVYAALGEPSLSDASVYFANAISVAYPKLSVLSDLCVDAEDSIETKLANAKNDAKALFDGTIIATGVDATPEAEKVYKAELYVATSTDENGDTYTQIVSTAKAAIHAAETFAEIDEALAAARTSLGQLMLAVDEDKVNATITAYTNSFKAYVAQQKAIMGTTDYRNDSFEDVQTIGVSNIGAANTEAAVKVAYDAAVSSVATIKKAIDITAAETAVLNQVKALPYASQITAADNAAVEAARKAYNELAATYGANAFSTDEYPTPISGYGKLADAEAALEALASADLAKKAEATAKKIAAITSTTTDAGAAAAVALKEEVNALAKEIAEFNKTAAVGNKIEVETPGADGTIVTAFVATIKDAEVYLVKKAIASLPVVITIDDIDAVKAAREAFDSLSDLQKASVQNSGALTVLHNAEKAVAAAEEAAKWTDKDVKAAMYDASKTTSYTKPSKTSVKLTAKADMTEIKENGYTVKYRFYQKGPKKTSYKLWKTSTSAAYTFKGLKAGTHSFKVKVSVYDTEGKLVAYKYTNVRTLKIK